MRKMILSCLDWTIQKLVNLRCKMSPSKPEFEVEENAEYMACNAYWHPLYDSHLIDKIAKDVPEVPTKCCSNEFHAQFFPEKRCSDDFYDNIEDPPIKDGDIKVEIEEKQKKFVEPPQDWHGLAKSEDDK